jgi:hypothetical protein
MLTCAQYWHHAVPASSLPGTCRHPPPLRDCHQSRSGSILPSLPLPGCCQDTLSVIKCNRNASRLGAERAKKSVLAGVSGQTRPLTRNLCCWTGLQAKPPGRAGRRGKTADSAGGSWVSAGRPDQRQDGGLDVLRQRRPGRDDASQAGVGKTGLRRPLSALWRKLGRKRTGLFAGTLGG